MVLDILEDILGVCPPGMEWLYYIFAFVVLVVGFCLIVRLAELPIKFISNFFRKK